MSAAPVPATSPWRGRYIVLAGVVLVALNLRIAVAAVSPVLEVVRRDVALDAAQVGLLGTIPVASFALFGSLAGQADALLTGAHASLAISASLLLVGAATIWCGSSRQTPR